RMHVTERGGDPSRPVLIAFGGAGPVHVTNLAAKLGIRRIVVPMRAGVLSAFGLVLAPGAFDIVRTRKVALEALDLRVLADDVTSSANTIRARLAEVGSAAPRFEVAFGLGYMGQSYKGPSRSQRTASPCWRETSCYRGSPPSIGRSTAISMTTYLSSSFPCT